MSPSWGTVLAALLTGMSLGLMLARRLHRRKSHRIVGNVVTKGDLVLGDKIVRR